MQGIVLVLYKVANKNKLLPYNQNSHNCIIYMYMYVQWLSLVHEAGTWLLGQL